MTFETRRGPLFDFLRPPVDPSDTTASREMHALVSDFMQGKSARLKAAVKELRADAPVWLLDTSFSFVEEQKPASLPSLGADSIAVHGISFGWRSPRPNLTPTARGHDNIAINIKLFASGSPCVPEGDAAEGGNEYILYVEPGRSPRIIQAYEITTGYEEDLDLPGFRELTDEENREILGVLPTLTATNSRELRPFDPVVMAPPTLQ